MLEQQQVEQEGQGEEQVGKGPERKRRKLGKPLSLAKALVEDLFVRAVQQQWSRT